METGYRYLSNLCSSIPGITKWGLLWAIFYKPILVEHSCTRSFLRVSGSFCFTRTVLNNGKRTSGPHGLEHLLPGPLLTMLVDPWPTDQKVTFQIKRFWQKQSWDSPWKSLKLWRVPNVKALIVLSLHSLTRPTASAPSNNVILEAPTR